MTKLARKEINNIINCLRNAVEASENIEGEDREEMHKYLCKYDVITKFEDVKELAAILEALYNSTEYPINQLHGRTIIRR